jgi:hypothetical protein
MKIRNEQNFWAGVMFLVFGLGFVVLAREYDMGTAQRMGPAYFPTILGGLLAALGLIVSITSLGSEKKREGKVEKSKDGTKVGFRLDVKVECPDESNAGQG